jgi:GWxTD domain-containing protein
VFQVDLEPTKYRLFLEIMDSGTGKGYRSSREFTVSPEYKYTEVKLFKVDEKPSGEIILGREPPLVEFNYDQKSTFSFRTPARDSLVITSKLLRVKDENSRIIRQKMYRLLADNSILNFDEIIDKKNLKEGRYLLRYRIKYREEVTNLEKYFTVVWFEKPVYLYKHDLALRPMIYVLSTDEYDSAEALSYDELGEWMEEYWNTKDPTPDTPLNEIQVEFFDRVDQANRKYSQRFTEGWETDRGKALILYGEPDRRESNRYAINSKPYEIWYYRKLNRKLTFVDKYKEENYVLVSVEEFEEKENE